MSLRNAYEQMIKNHDNYNFMPFELREKWVCVSKNGLNPRFEYWENRKKELIQSGKIKENSTMTNVARYIHSTKKHICKMCDNECSIFYEYPNKNAIKWLKKIFPDCEPIKSDETIFDVYNRINHDNKSTIFISKFGKSMEDLKMDCINDNYNGNMLSPGVMANPPDRLDGFHCYNSICGCRKDKDKGRSDENMKSYTRDRRSYEMFSDWNILLTNKIMGKLNTIEMSCPFCDKFTIMSGDHIGPISLGFVHDPINIQACCCSCNSSKNNRFTQRDYNTLILLENSGCKIVSWWAQDAWDKHKDKPSQLLKIEMDKNAKKFITIIEWIKINNFEVIKEFIEKEYNFDDNSYIIENITINNDGIINFIYNSSISNKKTKETQQNRTKEILLENKKDNRKINIILTSDEINNLKNITYETFKSVIINVLNFETFEK